MWHGTEWFGEWTRIDEVYNKDSQGKKLGYMGMKCSNSFQISHFLARSRWIVKINKEKKFSTIETEVASNNKNIFMHNQVKMSKKSGCEASHGINFTLQEHNQTASSADDESGKNKESWNFGGSKWKTEQQQRLRLICWRDTFLHANASYKIKPQQTGSWWQMRAHDHLQSRRLKAWETLWCPLIHVLHQRVCSCRQCLWIKLGCFTFQTVM